MDTWALLWAALLMGLAGGPHCVAMCGAACGGVVRMARRPAGAGGAAVLGAPPGATLTFHAARLAGYAAAGAAAAATFQGIGLAAGQLAALRPVWTLLHAGVLAWALVLMISGRQPVWGQRLGQALLGRLRPRTGATAGVAIAGALWVLWPCGLLYSALMLAALASGPAQGALAMVAFGLGSALWLVAAPWLWARLRTRATLWRQAWGTRLAGALLAGVAGQGLWLDLRHQVALWCA